MAGRQAIAYVCVSLAAIAVGCGSSPTAPTTLVTVTTTTRPAASSPAMLTLAEIQPKVELTPTTAPSTQPVATRSPLDAITLYARAVDALRTGRRFAAITLLQDAIKLDPQSFELHHALGRALVIGRTHDDQSIASLERAAAINPDDLELQTDLGRQYLSKGDAEVGMRHLRLAVQTSEYRADESGAAMTDLLLARALQDAGYDRAALEQYATLLRRVQGRPLSLRGDPQLAFLITDRLYVDIGDLYARNGQFEEALRAFEPAARRDPSDFDLEARVIRALVGLRRFDEASRRAVDAVVRFRASKRPLDLLREVHRAQGSDPDGGAADALVETHAQRPADTSILFALVELLRADDRWAEAEGYLAEQFERSPADFSVVRRWFVLRLERDDPQGAARLLIETLASTPDLATDIDDLWADAVSPARAKRLRLAEIQAMPVMSFQAAAKQLAVASVADAFNRDAVAEAALARGVKITPPFVPAFRARLAHIWKEAGTSEAEGEKQSDELIAAAGSSESPLALEMSGLSLLYRKQPKPAAVALAKAVEAGGTSPALVRSYAQAIRESGDTARFEQLMWKLLSDAPSYEDAHATLYEHYSDAGSEAQADRVLNTWLIASPHSTAARLLQAARHFRAGRADAARELIGKLLDERPDDPGVIRAAYAFYTRSGKTDALIATLEQHVRASPGNIAAVSALTEMYAEKGRSADVRPAIDAARRALADDPDNLYRVAHLYLRIGQREPSEETLLQVLAADPEHPPASNDLAYSWAERGENLARAEVLVRQAVRAEPRNASFLDSLGWVLYKRGKFVEARPSLEQAAGDGSQADPVVLDHLGDVLYRLGDKDAAAKQWQQAAGKLKTTPPRDELKRLQADLDRKTKQLKANEPVTVSPVVEEQQQAKN